MKKNYVLDTNVLLHDPQAIFRFEDNNVIIPIYVIEEVDQFKREGSERGRNARSIARLLDELRERGGSLSKGVPLDSGGVLRVAVPASGSRSPSAIDHTAMDQAILQTAFDVRENDAGRVTIFVTMDTNLRIRADALGWWPRPTRTSASSSTARTAGSSTSRWTARRSTRSFGRVAWRLASRRRAPNTCVLMRDRIESVAHGSRPLRRQQARDHRRCASRARAS